MQFGNHRCCSLGNPQAVWLSLTSSTQHLKCNNMPTYGCALNQFLLPNNFIFQPNPQDRETQQTTLSPRIPNRPHLYVWYVSNRALPHTKKTTYNRIISYFWTNPWLQSRRERKQEKHILSFSDSYPEEKKNRKNKKKEKKKKTPTYIFRLCEAPCCPSAAALWYRSPGRTDPS